MRMSNIAVPFVALLALVAADRALHPHRSATAPHLRCASARVLPSVDQIVANAGERDAASGLEYLGSVRTLPELRLELLNERHFYGWESSRPDAPDVVYADEQYPRQLALISAIERISHEPLTSVVRLSPDERRSLQRDAADCDRGAGARWLLHKLEGVPLPSEREIATANRVCARR